MNDHLSKAAELEAQAAVLEAEATAIEAAHLPDHCDAECIECSYKPNCDEVTYRIGKAYLLRQRAANLRRQA